VHIAILLVEYVIFPELDADPAPFDFPTVNAIISPTHLLATGFAYGKKRHTLMLVWDVGPWWSRFVLTVEPREFSPHCPA
jgi:hypothetical protein